MNRNRRLTVLLLATLALPMLAGLFRAGSVTAPGSRGDGQLRMSAIRALWRAVPTMEKDPETRVEPVTDENGEPVTDENGEIVTAVVPVGTETATGKRKTQDPYRDRPSRSGTICSPCTIRSSDPADCFWSADGGTPNGALRDSTDGQTGNAFGAAFDSLGRTQASTAL